MAETILNPTSNPATIVIDGEGRGRRDFGRAADHLAYETMTTSKDVLTNLNVHGGRMDDKFTNLNNLVADAQFRTLERFGITDVAVERNGGDTRTLLSKIGGELATQATLNAKDGIIDSAKNAAAIAKQVAECCCELKEKISDEAEETRELINSINTSSLERQLSDAKNALAGAQQSQGIINALLDKLVK